MSGLVYLLPGPAGPIAFEAGKRGVKDISVRHDGGVTVMTLTMDDGAVQEVHTSVLETRQEPTITLAGGLVTP